MRSSKARVVLGFVRGAGALALCLVAGFRVVSAAEVTLATKEVSLGNLPPGSIRLAVSPDSKRVGYVAQRGGQRLLVGREVLLLGSKWLVVLDGVEGRQYDGIGKGSPVFSPDSKRVGYGAHRSGKWRLVVDGVEGKEYGGFEVGTLVFSPDSQRVAYAAGRRWMWRVVVDGVEGKEYDGIAEGTLVFSPDGKRVAYQAQRGGKWLVVVDGVEGKEFDGFLKGSRLVFDNPTQFHTLALRGDEFLRVEVEIVMPAAEPSGAPRPHL
jgi:hypothetical protein